MIGAGGMLQLLEDGWEIPGRIGLAGFNGVELLDGFSTRLATMDALRAETGRKAAGIIARCVAQGIARAGEVVEMTPKLQPGDTLGRKTVFDEDG